MTYPHRRLGRREEILPRDRDAQTRELIDAEHPLPWVGREDGLLEGVAASTDEISDQAMNLGVDTSGPRDVWEPVE